ncbi:ATP-dependent Clp protease proteolytic subunit [Bradyrhizobium sp. BR 1433]|uniref:ATP-dependent Clp protease proteolytic subunit n=1 Tax=Bradyrhizobium sp. BR 1433 TaxID=3447967 RepID=UPI003EE78039
MVAATPKRCRNGSASFSSACNSLDADCGIRFEHRGRADLDELSRDGVLSCPGVLWRCLEAQWRYQGWDFVRFRGYLATERRVVGLDLDSRGGSLYEGFRIAMLAHQKQIASYVSGECDSACAFIFLASRKRYVAPNAKIGVHSVSNLHGNEDSRTIRDTIKLARLSAKLRIPPSAIGRMVMTPPGKISYLNKEELASLKVMERNPFDRTARAATAESRSGSMCGAAPSKSASEEERPMRNAAGSKGS